MKVNAIVDLQFGSTGKGLLAGYLAEETQPDVIVTANMPNAGHTYIDKKGQIMMFKVLPNGLVSPAAKYVLIGPGAVFDAERLMVEIQLAHQSGYDGFEVLIHPNATILQPEHKESERKALSVVSSTMQGSAAASIHKMMRQPDDNPTAYVQLPLPVSHHIRVCSHEEWMTVLQNAELIQAEGAQGFSLSLNQRFYPYCTSRDCTPWRLLSDMGLPNIRSGLTVYGSMRCHPIRVGNTSDGYSGDYYPDQREMDWTEIGIEPELTTVTKRPRRLFTFSKIQLAEALFYCRPDRLFLNFCNYLSDYDLHVLTQDIEEVAKPYGLRVDLRGFGPTYEDIRPTYS
jgi:adenylosuccinate synthase